MSARRFPLGDILSVTTGRLLSRAHMNGIYTLLDFMTGAGTMTHQIPRVMASVGPVLLAQHPQLAGVEPPQGVEPAALWAWLDAAEARFGAELPVTPLREWVPVDPVEELCDMVGAERVFVARLPEGGGQ